MNFFIQNGAIAKTKNSTTEMIGRTDLLLILKQMLIRLGVTFTDTCCPDTGFSPMRRNNTTNALEYLDYETGEYVTYTPGV